MRPKVFSTLLNIEIVPMLKPLAITVKHSLKALITGVNKNHLFGARRVYHSPRAASSAMLEAINGSRVVRRAVQRWLEVYPQLYVQAAVVGAEVRVNLFQVTHDTNGMSIGELCPDQSGIGEFLINRGGSDHQANVTVIATRQTGLYFNPYEPEQSLSLHLDDIAPSMLHSTPFDLLER